MTLVPLHDLFEVFDIHIKIITAIFSILALRALKFGLALGKNLFFMTKAMVGRVKVNSNASNRQTRPQIPIAFASYEFPMMQLVICTEKEKCINRL